MSKFCQHPDCPKTTQGLEQCPLCGYPVWRQPKPISAQSLSGNLAALGCLSIFLSFFLLTVFTTFFRSLPDAAANIVVVTTVAVLPVCLAAVMMRMRRRDIQIMSRILDPDKFQREVNFAIELGYPWAVITGAALLVGLPCTFLKDRYSLAAFPIIIISLIVVSIGMSISAGQFIYSKQLRRYRMPNAVDSGKS